VGTVYDQELLKKIREDAYAYLHGHEVGGTNPSLLEALAITDLNLLLDVGFNKEVGEDGALYWNKEEGNLANLINKADKMDKAEIDNLSAIAKKRMIDWYSWDYIVNEYESDPEIKINMKNSESGSSGGFMMTLAIYNAITSEDITKGLNIAGTGTIDSEGNVGVIGGVKYKLSGAVKNKADIFLVPEDNYEEAYNYKKEHNFDIELISISNFSEAIEYLQNKEV
jgi:PDZ domain-containing secreted protein